MAKKIKGKTTEQKIFIPNVTEKYKSNYSEKHVETLCQYYDSVIESGFSVSTIKMDSHMTVIEVSKDFVTYCFIRFNDKGEAHICKYNTKAKGDKVTITSHLANDNWYKCDIDKLTTFLKGI